MPKFYSSIILKCSLSLILLLVLSACNDVFEKRLEGETVVMIIPTANDTLFSNEVHFKWEEMKGADEYNLQIVSPAFSNIQTFVVDSMIQNDEVKIVLAPGNYEFKIRGENSAYVSDFINPVPFYVDSVNDLSSQVVQILTPADNLYTNNMQLSNTSWQNLFSASYYTFQLRSGSSFEAGSLIYEEPTIYSVNYDYFLTTGSTLAEGHYAWGVKAVNETTSSEFSSRQFSIDTTAPNTAVLDSPIDDFPSTTDEVTFKWSKNGADPGVVNSPLTSTLEVSIGDSLFTPGNILVFDNIEADSLVHQFASSGDYWWQVFLSDAAGNSSLYYSTMRKLTIP